MSSESRIWEIRPFGSMRGGRALVIGPWPFNPSSPAYSTTESGRFLRGTNRAVLPEPTDEANRCGYEFCQRGALEHSGRSCRTDGSGVTLRTCWSANPQEIGRAHVADLPTDEANRCGYEFCQRGALEHSGRSCRTDGSGVTLRTCWSANPQVGFREMLVDCIRSHSPFPLNEHRRKAPTWGPPRIPECM